MNIFIPIMLLFSIFNYNISLSQVESFALSDDFALEYDESFNFYFNENGSLVSVEEGAYKLRCIDNNNEYLILFHENRPLAFSIKFGYQGFREKIEIEDDILIDDLINKLGYRSAIYGYVNDAGNDYHSSMIYSIKHIYRKEILFIIFSPWDDADGYKEVRVFN